jgi:hypothetical protein
MRAAPLQFLEHDSEGPGLSLDEPTQLLDLASVPVLGAFEITPETKPAVLILFDGPLFAVKFFPVVNKIIFSYKFRTEQNV